MIQRLEQTPEEIEKEIEELIKSGRFYFIDRDEPEGQAVIIRKHNAEVIIFPNQDLDELSDGLINELIEEAIEVPPDPFDNPILKELLDLCPDNYNKRSSMIWGLYLYLANEVSRCPLYTDPEMQSPSFFAAGRDVLHEMQIEGKADYKGALLPNNNKAYKKEWFIRTLQKLNLYQYPHIAKLVEDWTNKGCFYVDGKVQYQGDDLVPHGKYVELAHWANDPRDGNKHYEDLVALALELKKQFAPVQEAAGLRIRTQQEALDIVSNLVTRAKEEDAIKRNGRNNFCGQLTELIDAGHKTRRQALKKAINEFKEEIRQKKAAIEQAKGRQPVYKLADKIFATARERSDHFNRDFLRQCSPEARKLMKSTRARYAIYAGKNLGKVYPIENPSGQHYDGCRLTRNSRGAYLPPPNNIVFVANGTDKEIGIKGMLRTVEHENGHMAVTEAKDSDELTSVKNSQGEILHEGAVSKVLRTGPLTLGLLANRAVAELLSISKPETVGWLMSRHDHKSAVGMFSTIRPDPRLKIFNRLADSSLPANYISENQKKIFLALEPEYQQRLFTSINSSMQVNLLNLLDTSQLYDLYRALDNKPQQKALYDRLNPQNQRAIDSLGTEYGNTYTPIKRYDLDQDPEVLKAIDKAFNKAVYVRDMFSVMTSGTINDIYFRLMPEYQAAFRQLLGKYESREMDQKLDDFKNNKIYLTSKSPTAERRMHKKICDQMARQLGTWGSPEIADDLIAKYKETGLMRLKYTQIFPKRTIVDVLNIERYSDYPDRNEWTHELMQRLREAIVVDDLRGKVPDTKYMKPLHDLMDASDLAMYLSAEYSVQKAADKQKLLSLTAVSIPVI